MKTLDPLIVAFLGKQDDQHVICLNAKELMLKSIGTYRYELLAYLDFTNNQISSVSKFREYFPSAWWIIFRGNNITRVSASDFATAIGLIDLSCNNNSLEELIKEFQTKYVLRLNVKDNRAFNSKINTTRAKIVRALRNLWVLDDDFISFGERQASLRSVRPTTASFGISASVSSSSVRYQGDWSPTTFSEREVRNQSFKTKNFLSNLIILISGYIVECYAAFPPVFPRV
jgi:Leucine-rich repeat (LRR) protein